jgi:hypothetical protein
MTDRRTSRTVIALMLFHTILLSWCAVRNSFSWTETGLLPAGIIDWRYGSFDVFRVNPPLVRMWATLPVLAFDPEIPFRGVSVDPRNRAEWDVARAMIDANGEAAFVWLTVARLMCIPFSLLGMWTAFRWASELFGNAAGIGAVLLWTFSPMMIGYGSLMSGDAQAASMGLVTLYVFRCWLRDICWARSYMLGITAGLTILTKTSWFSLFGLLPLLWLVIRGGEWFGRYLSQRRGKACDDANAINDEQRRGVVFYALRETSMAIGSLLLCLLVINLAYGFDGTFKRLGEFEFISKALTKSPEWRSHNFHGNRFSDSWLASIPVPLPEDLVIGMDLQKWDFDRERWSYLRGEWRTKGWWYYYLYALAIKVPLGMWSLILIAIIGGLTCKSWREPWQDFLLLTVPALLLLTAASSETGLNRHVRYVLPIVPMVFVLTSRVFRSLTEDRKRCRFVVCVSTSWMIVSSLWIFPHSHSYFNEAIGGPLHGAEHLNASNLDWGQDLMHLKRWCNAHPECQPRWIKSYLHLIDPAKAGISNAGSVPNLPRRTTGPNDGQPNSRFPSGWYIIDNESILRESGDYLYLNELQPYAFVGYGFRVYEITPEIADRLDAIQQNEHP